MVRKNDTVTSEADASAPEPEITSGTPAPEQEGFLLPRAEVREAFPFPGDTQSGGSRNPAPGYLSSSVVAELEMYGSTVDPATGQRLTREDLDAWRSGE